MNKKVVNMRSWPTTVPHPSIDELLNKKKKQRKERIEETKEKVNRSRGK
jgi:hypothetical protein